MKRLAIYQRGLHIWTMVTSASTFCLVIAGGLVTSTGSALAVPDWPLSYGQLMPPMVGGVLYEHGHRMIATVVGILTTILAFWVWRRDSRPWVRVLGVLALCAIVVQGVLGGLTVLYLLPIPISVAHATLAQSFFSLTVILALATSRGWIGQAPRALALAGITRRYAIVAGAAVFLQLVLGAWMRHSDAGLAIIDFPTTYGNVLPPSGPEGLSSINAQRAEWFQLPPVTLTQLWIHFAHRLGAIVALAAVLACGIHILRCYPSEKKMREPALVMIMLVVAQFLFGAMTVWTGKAVQVSTTHVATGALLLGTVTVLLMRAFHMYSLPDASPKDSAPS
ncbi:MAG TPA: COX15/CtaA family protein [Bacteroidota bacterium]|nr:COX15/CtaA family protein [Bacteroidota bacterium]